MRGSTANPSEDPIRRQRAIGLRPVIAAIHLNPRSASISKRNRSWRPELQRSRPQKSLEDRPPKNSRVGRRLRVSN
eukprot:10317852-Alexandrium_andersonii.AAC.1